MSRKSAKLSRKRLSQRNLRQLYFSYFPQEAWKHWPFLLLPALFVGLFEYIRHALFHDLSVGLGNAIAAALALFGSFIYYILLFRIVHRLSKALHQQLAREKIIEARERIAADLHDSLAQTLFFANVQLKSIDERLREPDIDQANREIELLREALNNAYNEIRQVIDDLKASSKRTIALLPSMRQRVAEFRRQTGINVSLQLPDLEPELFDPQSQIAELLLSGLQEALWNAGKHASPSLIEVFLHVFDAEIQLTVRDDGRGFDPSTMKAGFGIARLREQTERLQGTFVLDSDPQKGTTLQLILPLQSE